MSMLIGNYHSNRRRIDLKDASGRTVGSISYTQPSRKKKKKLQYNFKAMSIQIMQAKTSGSARQVASRARRQVAMLRRTATLQRNLSTEEYDEDELESALSHAMSLERVARKRVKHLVQEEALKNNQKAALWETDETEEELSALEPAQGSDPEALLEMSEEELKRLMKELEKAMRAAQENAAEMSAAENVPPQEEEIPQEEEEEELEETVSDRSDALSLEQLKKKHRSQELREIMEADMKYLKALFQKLAREKQETAGGGSSDSSGGAASSGSSFPSEAVSLQLSGMEVPVPQAAASAPVEGGNMDITL